MQKLEEKKVLIDDKKGNLGEKKVPKKKPQNGPKQKPE
jgi:hypothetical protein